MCDSLFVDVTDVTVAPNCDFPLSGYVAPYCNVLTSAYVAEECNVETTLMGINSGLVTQTHPAASQIEINTKTKSFTTENIT